MKTSKIKIGRYPLQRVGGETQAGNYESADYLYEHPAGYVWLRVVHDLRPGPHLGERSLALDFVYQGYRYNRWQPPLVVDYSERRLRKAAKDFADEAIAAALYTA